MQQAQPSEHDTSSSVSWRSAGLFAVRYGIGAVMVLAAVVVLIVVPSDIGFIRDGIWIASALGAVLSVVLLNMLYRLSVSGDREREREEEARRYLDEDGVWPDRRRTSLNSRVGGSFPGVWCWRSKRRGRTGPRVVTESR